MNRRQLQAEAEQARRRAVDLGETGDARAIDDLVQLCAHSGPTVRRAAASALGKLAANEGIRRAVPKLCALLKQKLYQQEGKKLISLYPTDLSQLDGRLSAALSSIVLPGRG